MSSNTPTVVIKDLKEREPQREDITLPLWEIADWVKEKTRANAPFRHTNRTVHDIILNNLEGKAATDTPLIDRDRSGGASRPELRRYLQEVRTKEHYRDGFSKIFQKQVLNNFSKIDIDGDGELTPYELLMRRPRETLDDRENRSALEIPEPSEADKAEVLSLRQNLPESLLKLIDSVNTRRDFRVEKILLEISLTNLSEGTAMLQKLAQERVRVIMPPRAEDMGRASARVMNAVSLDDDGKYYYEGLILELAPDLERPFVPILRNELFHIRYSSDVAKQVSGGRGYPLSAEESARMRKTTLNFDNELVSSIAEVTEPGEKISFRDFYDRITTAFGTEDGLEKGPEHYFGIAYERRILLEEPTATPVRELLLTYIDPAMEEKELRAFERFSSSIKGVVREAVRQNRSDTGTYLSDLSDRFDKLNPHRTPDLYYGDMRAKKTEYPYFMEGL